MGQGYELLTNVQGGHYAFDSEMRICQSCTIRQPKHSKHERTRPNEGRAKFPRLDGSVSTPIDHSKAAINEINLHRSTHLSRTQPPR